MMGSLNSNETIKYFKIGNLDNLGQSVVEYVLLLSVASFLAYAMMGRFKSFIIGTTPCPNPSYYCKLEATFGGNGYFTGNYRYFQLNK